MEVRLHSISRLSLLLVFTLLLAGCPTQPPRPGPEAYTSREKLIQLAEAELKDAARADAPGKSQHLLIAADAYRRAEEPRLAEETLLRIDKTAMQVPQLAEYTLLYTDLALAGDRFFLARKLLTDPRLETGAAQIPPELRARWHLQRGDLFALLGEETAAVAEYRQLSATLSDAGELQKIHDKLWRVLTHTPAENLTRMAKSAADSEQRGWYELALISRQSQRDIRQQIEEIHRWREANPGHPATRYPPKSLQQLQQVSSRLPVRVAMLLPLSGEFAAAAATLRDGFLAGFYQVYQKGGHTPELMIYDTMSADAGTLYQRAVADGAQIVVGPLRREQLQKLAALQSLPVAAIGLNYLDTPLLVPHNLYQFGLSAADEARQVAERAWIEGKRSAITIVPDTSWGTGALEAFRSTWLAKGGSVVEATPYSKNQQDFSPVLRPVLLVDQSRERALRLERTLGKDLEFTPRRRQDVDMIFLVANPAQGRQIKPTLDFFYAGDLRIYATSHIFAGRSGIELDRDLEGIRFSAMPWALPDNNQYGVEAAGNLPPAYRNLFALGLDAYQLHQWIGLLKALPDTSLHGHTGNLRLAAGNRVERELPWAEFRLGQVRPAPQLSQ